MTNETKQRLLDCVAFIKQTMEVEVQIFRHYDSPLAQSVRLNALADSVRSLSDVVQNVLQND